MEVRTLKTEERNGYVLTMKYINLGFGMEHINGYVSVPDNSPLSKRDYDDMYEIDVHGGLTYLDNMGGKWTFGFNTAHYNDNIATQNEIYVWNEIESLYDQLKELSEGDKRFTVWVDGTEVNDYYLTKDEAEILAEKWKDDGYAPLIDCVNGEGK